MEENKGKRELTDEERRRRARILRRRKREAEIRRNRIILLCIGIILLLLIIFGLVSCVRGIADKGDKKASKKDSKQQEALAAEDKAEEKEDVVAQADRLAAMYDYDKAIELLKGTKGYEESQEMQDKVASYEETKATCKPYPIEEITHVFYHTLIKDPSKAFDGDYKEGDYNQVMTTIDEFNKITQIMYDKGYVLVDLHDIAVKDSSGKMTAGEIMLPPGKIPFVLSQDDVSYYHYMEGDGYASRLIIDENGDIKNEYVEDDGTVSVGDYDMVPLIDRFVEEHPDFSYRGAKGTLAMTGYNGLLGYWTDVAYQTKENLDDIQVEFLEEHPDFDYDWEVKEAKKVADAMKANGWRFASHTWGHMNVSTASVEDLRTDTEKYKKYMEPILGETDVIIFAFGADLNDWEDYSGDKFEYLKSQGFDYFCNVDSSKYFVQLRDNYFRMGRRNLDGYRMYYNPELLEDLFDAKEVFDKARPTPVPEMG